MNNKKKEEYHVSRMSSEELKNFVNLWFGNRVFTSLHIHEDMWYQVPTIFMPIGLGAFKDVPEETIKEEFGILWEDLDKAAPLAVNGMPSFFSVNIMHKKDWELCKQAISFMEKGLNEFDWSDEGEPDNGKERNS